MSEALVQVMQWLSHNFGRCQPHGPSSVGLESSRLGLLGLLATRTSQTAPASPYQIPHEVSRAVPREVTLTSGARLVPARCPNTGSDRRDGPAGNRRGITGLDPG